ncbi:MAG: MoxR family ATPase [Nitrososphaerota archaeon]|nr:MoxR family ATPase [Candidatus Bathyarchaeota archaeon]MDW8022227.1 MoxR family ATPase [Nitrososphaerota archaeon]
MKDEGKIISAVINEVGKLIVGKEEVLKMVMLGILSNGHILFEDYPGLAKTMIAKSFAMCLGCDFKRVQFTPDLLPADITGTYVFNQKTSNFTFKEGPIFTNILLADEINRAPPKTQSALLEAMQEKQVTIDGITHSLKEPFMVMATQNPIELEGTYPLPEAQLDRFIMKIRVGYPSVEHEAEILKRRLLRKSDSIDVKQVADPGTVVQLQKAVEQVYVDDDILRYIAEIVQATRRHPKVEVGASPRGSLAILKLARSHALYNSRDYVTPDDVKSVAVPALCHRIIFKTEYWFRGVTPESIIEQILSEVPVPKFG